MTPEERAEMEAAAENGDPAAQEAIKTTTSPAFDPATAGATVPDGTTKATPRSPTADHGAGQPNLPNDSTSLTHHSSYNPSPSASTSASSSTDVSKNHNQSGKDRKGKSKLTPEQKAKLEALEKKQEEEKKARWASSISLGKYVSEGETESKHCGKS